MEHLITNNKNIEKSLKETYDQIKSKNQKVIKDIIEKNKKKTISDINKTYPNDWIISNTIRSIGELDKQINIMTKRFREMINPFYPEAEFLFETNKDLVDAFVKKKIKSYIKKHTGDNLGQKINKNDKEFFWKLLNQINSLIEIKKEHIIFLEGKMDEYCPNLKKIAGASVGAALLEITGSLKKLSMMASSAIQILGAEKALFRHLTKGASSPKYGVIINHKLIGNTRNEKLKGKQAKIIAEKISIAAKKDFFKTGYDGDNLYEEMLEKIKKIKV